MTDELEADYVIVGAGAVAMAFADTLLTDTGHTIVMADRRHAPGGHWNDAYPFVRLHSPSLNYGVNSAPLGSEAIEQTGANRGLHELATGPEICAYYDRLMRRRFLPSGRVTWLPLTEVGEDGVATSRASGDRARLHAHRKTVDATFADTRLPATHPPAFKVAPGATLVSPTGLSRLKAPCEGFVIIGAGKTAMDTVIWLLEQGADPGMIRWIRPRDSWLLTRERLQPSDAFFADTFDGLALEMEAARDATSTEDLFARLEAAGMLARIDPAVRPTMYRCAIVSRPELDQLRRVADVVRMGHVLALEPDRIVLEHGEVPTSPGHVHVDCTADGIPRKAPEPIFQDGRIVLQYVRRCSPTFSGALIAHVEATADGDDAEKNRLCAPIPPPDEPDDWLRMHLAGAGNAAAWSQSQPSCCWRWP